MDRPMRPRAIFVLGSIRNAAIGCALYMGSAGVGATDANLLPSGNFATADDASTWTPPAPAYGYVVSLQWVSDDADSYPLSGSLNVLSNGAAISSPCFAVTPGAGFAYGGTSKALGIYDTSSAFFSCESFSDAICSQGGTDLSFLEFLLVRDTWYTAPAVIGTLPADAATARCDIFVIDPHNVESVLFDDLDFISAEPQIFQDGFESL